MTAHRISIVLLACSLVPAMLAAQQAPSCDETPGFSKLDFWVGEWDVFVGDRQVGENRIEKILDGCAVVRELDRC
jgi:hypothetical protein